MPRLVRVHPFDDPGYRRVRSGSGFRYRDPRGHRIPAKDRTRIRELVIPPAWQDVWISVRPAGTSRRSAPTPRGGGSTFYHAALGAATGPSASTSACSLSPRRCRGRGTGDDGACAGTASAATGARRRLPDYRPRQRPGSAVRSTCRARQPRVDHAAVPATPTCTAISSALPSPASRCARQLLEAEDVDLAAAVVLLPRAAAALGALSPGRRGRRTVPLRPRGQRLRARGDRQRVHREGLPHAARHGGAAESLARTGLVRGERGPEARRGARGAGRRGRAREHPGGGPRILCRPARV